MAELLINITRAVDSQNLRISKKHHDKFRFWEKKYNFPADTSGNTIFNLTDQVFSPSEENLLRNGLKNRIPTETDPFRTIGSIESVIQTFNHVQKSEIRNIVAAKINRRGTFDIKPKKQFFQGIKNIKNNKELVVCRADKGGSTVIMNRLDYQNKMETILEDNEIFEPISKAENSKSIAHFKKTLASLKKNKKINDEQYKSFINYNTDIPYIYGLPKLHKEDIPLRPIVAYHLSPAIVVSRFLSSLLSPHVRSRNIYSINNIADFIGDIRRSIPDPHIAEIVLLTIDGWINSRENLGIKKWRRYIDDIYCEYHLGADQAILDTLNSYHPEIKFTIEREENHPLPYLDALIFRNRNSFQTTVHYKGTAKPSYIPFNSYSPISFKISVVKTLTKRLHTHCSLRALKEKEKENIYNNLRTFGYPPDFIRKHTFIPFKKVTLTVNRTRGFIDFSPTNQISEYPRNIMINSGFGKRNIIFQQIPQEIQYLTSPIKFFSPSEENLLRNGLKNRIPTETDPFRTIGSIESVIQTFNHVQKSEIRNIVAAKINRRGTFDIKPKKQFFQGIKNIKNNKELVVCRADKGGSTVIMNRLDYQNKMETILEDNEIFEPISKAENSKSIAHFKKTLASLKKNKKINDEQYKSFINYNTDIPYIYGLPKLHKEDIPLRPIVAYHLSPAIVVSRFLSSLLSPHVRSRNIYSINNIADFIGDIRRSIPDPHIAEIVLLTIDGWINSRENLGIKKWRRYIDDIYCEYHLGADQAILDTLNSYHPEIKFTIEREENHPLPYLDALIFRNRNSFQTTVHYKGTAKPSYIPFNSYSPISFKISVVKTLTKRLHTHCSLRALKEKEKENIYNNLRTFGYPPDFIRKHTFIPFKKVTLTEMFTNASAFLYKATKHQVFFREVIISLPRTWSSKPEYSPAAGDMFDSAEVRVDQPNPNFGNDPYTLQPGGCGDPGLYVHFTPDFILGSYNQTMGNIGTAGRQVVHEWAHLRYGVFDEYGIPGDSQYPAFYFEKNGENKTMRPTTCNKQIRGGLEGDCAILGNGMVGPNCKFMPDPTSKARASIMYIPDIHMVRGLYDKSVVSHDQYLTLAGSTENNREYENNYFHGQNLRM
ncbi:hypothetical protein LAZ67_13002946 [Cordylochernes scorpioides]|uniref:Uncharacterized protein n=1 Tax=Cordylochernes scorpioides TaxID=51811 RepID=A0ABY6L5B0_9ARAC|nr:hypothetical protein LAZ67_13002946 [Cordylochernes scorpioides]